MTFRAPPNILAAFCCNCDCSWEDHPTKLEHQDGRCINGDGCMAMVEPTYKADGDPECIKP